ncbi:MAG: tRNA (adenosine(37)-N6)-threonylcarbamoyltransferase complex dimerization subunit type 1 TsaB [Candidatus Dormibacteraeota bacterium]|nr:tRNA (adenosine(37)-N6)-threonylcarbamoyltransferase complex dimerization subunit type 1 TsaB [Candidatus Dormibacteraeota bacterium]
MTTHPGDDVRVLMIDTSSRRRVVCVLAQPFGELISGVREEGVDIDRALPPALHSLLSDEVTHVAVVTGPGSYTGLRAGMAAALGIAHARGLTLCGLPSLVPINHAAEATGARQGWAVADAGRGAIYAMRFSGNLRAETARVELSDFGSDGEPVFSADALPIDGVRHVDPALGLALAVDSALGRPLAYEALRGEYEAG